jgi:hypothetical protein
MLWHADNSTYGWLLQGLATSDTVAGPYEFVSATSPLGNWSQDFGLFTDRTDARSYALYSNGDSVDGRDVYLTRYNTNITALEEVVRILSGLRRIFNFFFYSFILSDTVLGLPLPQIRPRSPDHYPDGPQLLGFDEPQDWLSPKQYA